MRGRAGLCAGFRKRGPRARGSGRGGGGCGPEKAGGGGRRVVDSWVGSEPGAS